LNGGVVTGSSTACVTTPIRRAACRRGDLIFDRNSDGCSPGLALFDCVEEEEVGRLAHGVAGVGSSSEAAEGAKTCGRRIAPASSTTSAGRGA